MGDIKLVYASRAVRPMKEADLADILASARKHNASENISGMLIYAGQSFLQLLEGERGRVEALYARIESDVRHFELRLLASESITDRKFKGWSMGFESMTDAQARVLFDLAAPSEKGRAFIPSVLIKNAGTAERVLNSYAASLA